MLLLAAFFIIYVSLMRQFTLAFVTYRLFKNTANIGTFYLKKEGNICFSSDGIII